VFDKYLYRLPDKQMNFHVLDRNDQRQFTKLLLQLRVLCDYTSNRQVLEGSVNVSKDSVLEMLQKLTDRFRKLEVAAMRINLTEGDAERQRTTNNINQHAGENVYTNLN